jgi:hypothetical protein
MSALDKVIASLRELHELRQKQEDLWPDDWREEKRRDDIRKARRGIRAAYNKEENT